MDALVNELHAAEAPVAHITQQQLPDAERSRLHDFDLARAQRINSAATAIVDVEQAAERKPAKPKRLKRTRSDSVV